MCVSDYTQATFFYLERFLKKLSDDQCSLIPKGSIYHIKHISIQYFTTEVNWPKISCLMEVSTMFDICTYCVFQDTSNTNVMDSMIYTYINTSKDIFLSDIIHPCIYLDAMVDRWTDKWCIEHSPGWKERFIKVLVLSAILLVTHETQNSVPLGLARSSSKVSSTLLNMHPSKIGYIKTMQVCHVLATCIDNSHTVTTNTHEDQNSVPLGLARSAELCIIIKWDGHMDFLTILT